MTVEVIEPNWALMEAALRTAGTVDAVVRARAFEQV